MNSCEECDGECCRYITVSINEPKDFEDWDEIKWFLLHENVIVYLDYDDDWVVEFRTKCRYLDDKTGKCINYDERLAICREHDPKDCDKNSGDFAKVLFRTMADVDNYLKEKDKTLRNS